MCDVYFVCYLCVRRANMYVRQGRASLILSDVLATLRSSMTKSRLIMQTFNDSEKQKILTQTPIIQRINQRFIIALSLIIS